ncbi:MAG: Flp pilus assembly complex ATPase component TadA [Bacillus sp. (in: Bacteria)]|nr:Flp pilus assembly complex ATPase component TadA [Bacillus sp. (in: firmicutes)]MCM1426933.1 Flp pilus assembly complex ATPase component TadA [Eubacterium sp.]
MPIIEEIMRAAENEGASDVHIIVGTAPKMRVNGELFTMGFPKMTEKDTLEILLGMMTPPQRERFEERGEYDMSFAIGKLGRYRVHAYREKGRPALALRLIGMQPPSPETLGIPESVAEMCERKQGLVLITGVSGSGKSTTLAALVNKINYSREAHIITLESPIEYLHQHGMSLVSQREIGTDALSYAGALYAAMREDADVIFIDEMQGVEAIDAAIAAAEAGHLVFAAMNAADNGAALAQILDAFPLSGQKQAAVRLSNVIEALMAQKLVLSANGKARIAEFETLRIDDTFRAAIKERKVI